MWNIEDDSTARRFELAGAGFLHALSAGPDGELVAVGDSQGVLWLKGPSKLSRIVPKP
jgi:hypothetical protein